MTMESSSSKRFNQSDQVAYADVIAAWDKVKFGGIIVCTTPGKAVSLRQRMYKIRKKIQNVNGSTMWDDMIIRLEYNDTRLYVTRRDEGIAEIIPANVMEQEVEYTTEGKNDIIISQKTSAKYPSRATKEDMEKAIDGIAETQWSDGTWHSPDDREPEPDNSGPII